MALFAIAIPVAPGKTREFEAFIKDLNGGRREAFVASRKKLGVRERTFLQNTPMGDFVLVTLEGADPAAAFARFGEGTDAFTQWFSTSVSDIHAVDFDAPPPGPLPTLIVDSGT